MDAGPLKRIKTNGAEGTTSGLRREAMRLRRPPKRVWALGLLVVLILAVAGLSRLTAPAVAVHPKSTLRIAMTSGDLPTTTGAPTQGLEGVRFAGYPVFEPLVMWDLRVTDRPPGIIPWLATDWTTDPANRNKWIFHLRRDVKFQDGSPFNAAVVVWNLERLYDPKAPQYEAASAAGAKSRAPMVEKWEEVDPYTVAIYTNTPTSFFPEIVASLLMVSPARWREVGGDWHAFGQRPSGTGAFRITKVDRTSITMDKNPRYWNTARAAKLDRVVLYAMPEPTTRIAALRSGEVDWIENPPPDAIPFLRKSGYTVSAGPMEHVWAYWLRITPDSPFRDVRVRQAFNYAMDREGLVALLNGAAQPAKGYWKPGDPRFGKPKHDYAYDPAKSRALLQEAGYKSGELVKVKVLLAPAGSGQMLALPMNELVQQSARPAGFDLSFEVVEYSQIAAVYGNKPMMDDHGVQTINKGFSTADLTWLYYSFYPPNVVDFADKETMALLENYRNDFVDDEASRQEILAHVHERLVDLAPWAWVVHDVNPRAFSPKVQGYTPAQTWFTDLTTVYIKE